MYVYVECHYVHTYMHTMYHVVLISHIHCLYCVAYAKDHQPCVVFMDEIDAIGTCIMYTHTHNTHTHTHTHIHT